MLFKPAGTRPEPAVSVPSENATSPRATTEADPELESALVAAFTAAGTAIYYVIARVLEVHVSPKFGWLLGLAKSPDGYSEGQPPEDNYDPRHRVAD